MVDWAQVLRVNPRSVSARRDRAKFFFEQGNWAAAVTEADHALTWDPRDYDSLFVRVRSLWYLSLCKDTHSREANR